MSIVDIIILILLIPFVINGIKNGLVKQITSIASIFIGIYLAYRFADLVSTWLNELIAVPENVVKIIAFVLIIVGVILSVSLITSLIQKILKITMLSWLDKLLGFVLSLLVAAMILGVVISIIDYINDSWFILLSKERTESSVLYPKLREFSETFFPYLKQLF